MVRASLIRNIRAHFECFLKDAKMQELYFLDSLLADFGSSNYGPDDKAAESPLAEAFMALLDSDETYVRVSRDHVEAVEEFLEKITAATEGNPPANEPVGRPKLLVFPPRQEAPHAS